MTTQSADTKISTLDLSEGAQDVLQQIIQMTGKSAGAIVAEGLSLAQLYEQNRLKGGKLLVELDGARTEITVP
jgi:hypothetical protein